MKFDVYSDDLAEELYFFMEDRFDEFSQYLSESPKDISMAEYVDTFLRSEFRQHLIDKGYQVE